MEKFDLDKEEVLTILKKFVADGMLRLVNKCKKISYPRVQEFYANEECIIDSQIDET